ncbi:hypothetical protein H7F15_16745 [Pontibacter sp. Tf4]|uniref:hypothetical protein n=1 Tax=Pontibacter sp. Tf4 TaxID=2761620 RepID=UPI0016257C45|nr:hypothetical protein [Pontibacter sp. Tf4]MBB6612693.1 hypothetical protein [Pontibacter sp. Tf4]
MNKLKLILLWCLVVGALASCTKEDDTTPNLEAAEDYFPTTAGSNWTYGGAIQYTARVTGNTKEINGKTYFEYETQQGSTSNKSYLLKENGNYSAVGFMPNTGQMEIFILKEESIAGKPWVQEFTINGVLTTLTMSVEQKGITKTVGDKTFDDVVNVKAIYTYSYMGQDLGTEIVANYYYAKGVGLILSDFGAQGQVKLLSYEIK